MSTEEEKLRWYVIQAYSGSEKFVLDVLKKRIVEEQLEDQFGDVLVPEENIIELRKGQRTETKRKYYPGYVLVQMRMNDESWHLVKQVPRVLRFIGSTTDKHRPVAISDKEATAILQRVEESVDKPKPKVLFEPGEVIRVVDGPFADFNGVVEEVNYEKNRLRVAVLIFGRSTPVELEFSQVEKA